MSRTNNSNNSKRKNVKPDQNTLHQRILDLLRTSDKALKRSEMVKRLHLRGADRTLLKDVLRDLQMQGEIDRGERRCFTLSRGEQQPEQLSTPFSRHPKQQKQESHPKNLPHKKTMAAEIMEVDEEGDLYAQPLDWEEDKIPPRIHLVDLKETYRRGRGSLGIGDRVILDISYQENGEWEGRIVRRILKDKLFHLGIFQPSSRRRGSGGMISSLHRKDTLPGVHISQKDCQNLSPGDIIQYKIEQGGHIQIVHRLGHFDDPKMFSEIAIYNQNLPYSFSSEAIQEAESGKIPPLGKRMDLRDLDLVTIDGEDAQDFDDAVWAKADEDPRNIGGWRAVVAIADVSYYVRLGSDLDREARKRGNSVYFPDRVVPMLPEALSNELCSLKPHVDRACLVIEMIISSGGKLKSHRVKRGLMKSRARLTYTQVQRAMDGHPDKTTQPLLETVIKPLYGVYHSLLKARNQRGTLELNIPERQVLFDEAGDVKDIIMRERLESHKLIEELMIAANVAAAKTLMAKNWPCLFRVHEPPEQTRVDNLRQFLKPYPVKFAKGVDATPRLFNDLLHQVEGRPFEDMVNQLVLRSQSQAKYSPEDLGHFGLSLSHYAHFTSPIRRYADLVIHRSLVGALDLGEGGYADRPENLAEIGMHISQSERKAVDAEREVMDRYAISYVAHHVGEVFDVVITGANRFGLFVQMHHSGAEGFLPKGSLGDVMGDSFFFEEQNFRMVGRRTRTSFQLGDRIQVTLSEANPTTSTLIFRLVKKARKKISPPSN